MIDEPSPTPVIRDWPRAIWAFGSIFGGFGALMVLSSLRKGDTYSVFVGTIVSGIGLVMFALASVLTIRVDNKNGLLILTYRSLMTKKVKEVPLRQIESIDVEAFTVVIIERDGQVTPLRPNRSGGTAAWGYNRRLAKRLRDLIGVGGSNGGRGIRKGLGMLTGGDPQVNEQVHQLHEALTSSHDEMSATAGVRWTIQTAGMARTPITRWFSPDSKTNGTFVYLAQVPAFGNTLGGKLGKQFTHGMIGKLAARASMALHGFVGDDVPTANLAKPLPLDPPLNQNFVAFCPDPAAARQVLNPSVAEALADWAARHPLETNQAGNAPAPLVVLFSPSGVYAAIRELLDPSRLAELAATGAELVRAQQRNAS